jgi:outer membrane lipoprotein SlyB
MRILDMKGLTGIAIASVVSIGIALNAVAESMKPVGLGGQQINGQVESVNGSTLKVKTSNGETQTYNIEPSVISALKLETGSNIVIDGTRLTTGTISSLDPYTAEVVLDKDGEERSYILTREARRYLSVGDRVIITPDQRVVSADRYRLSSSDLRMQSVAVASSSKVETSSAVASSSSSSSKTVTPSANTGGAEIPEPAAPQGISGLW